jgi:hypothetical protein
VARRASFVSQTREEQAAVVVDAGNFSGSRDKWGTGMMKGGLLARFMAWAGYDAVNVGEREAGFGLGYVLRLRDLLGEHLVSANVRRTDGTEVVSPWVTRKIGSIALGITGVVGASFLQWTAAESLAILDPRAELPSVVRAMRHECDVVILLACTHEAEARELARLTGVDVVVTRAALARVDTLGDAPPWVLSGGRRGEKVGLATFDVGARGLMLVGERQVALDEAVPSDGQTQRMVDELKARIKAARAAVESSSAADRPGYVGHVSCGKCHGAIERRWARTAHASAGRTLVEKGRETAPECLRCHVTGYGQPGGFRDMTSTPWLMGVQCESCHGPGGLHVMKGGALPYGSVSALDCVRCHTVKQSPDFSYERGQMEGIH